ncbi:MAG: mucoidy inhibitor MuiA family protein [Desulfobacterales bacterium]|nr:MAG: mucoidy inhibitor MuiA family protein [Desulfobacterales bacterium]
MKKLGLVVLFFLVCEATPAVAEQIVPSQISRVTLFSSRALIGRQATATVPQGLNEIWLEIESFSVDPDSVTARVFGEGEIYSVQFKEVPRPEFPQENIKALEQQIEQLKKSRRRLFDQKHTLQKNEAFLNAFIEFSQTQIPKEIQTRFPSTEDLNQTLSFLGSNYRKLSEEGQSIDASLAAIEKEIGVLEKELSALRGTTQKKVRVIEILFNSRKSQPIRIETQYLAQKAEWKPLYKVSVPTTLSEIDLTMFAKIRQKTGEDWKQVALSISNVIPLSGVRLPSLSSWLLDMPRAARDAVIRPEGLAERKAAPAMEPLDEEAAPEAPAEEAVFIQARKHQRPLSFEYALPQPLNIESRDKETILPLFSKQLPGDFYYFAVPKQSALTFLVTRVKADEELLDGPLNVYFGGQYVGKTHLEEKRAGEEFYLNLGADREVMVKRETLKDKVKETFLGTIERNTVIRELAYKITVENIKDQPVMLQILDNIPVSKTDRIGVEDVKIIPEPVKRNYLDQEGVMLWELKLDPGAKKEIKLEFALSYPKGFSPLGF